MQRTTRAYKEEQRRMLRNESYVYVYLGVISREAQSSARSDGSFAAFSDEQTIFSQHDMVMRYATAEQDFTKMDGSQAIIPDDDDSYVYWQGLVTNALADDVTFTFVGYSALSWKGLTIDFGEYYPESFKITNGTTVYTYTNDAPGVWMCEDVFENTGYLRIYDVVMAGGYQRLRIQGILFGIGFNFDNNSLMSTRRHNKVSHISASLPSKEFQFTVSNIERKFAQDDPHSFIAYLQEQQEVTYDYGRKMDDGTIYMIPGGKVALKSWSSNNSTATFTAVGRLDYKKDKYYKGTYAPLGRTLYALAEDVLEDAGIEDYELDSYLSTVYTTIPLPLQPHKNLLQLIANAARSVLYEDRDGTIRIKSSFEPDIVNATAVNNVSWGDPWLLTSANIDTDSLASGELNWTRMDGSQQLYSNPISTPYLSEITTQTKSVTITFEAQWTFYDLPLVFDKKMPSTITVSKYSGNTEESETYTISSPTTMDENTYVIEDEFYQVDAITISFTCGTNERVHLKSIALGNVTDYTLTYNDMKSAPTAKNTDRVKDINVHYYGLEEGTQSKNLKTVEAVSGTNLIMLTKPCHGFSLTSDNNLTLTITNSGPYYVEFTSSGTGKVKIGGYEYTEIDTIFTKNVNEVGVDRELKNPLIDSRALADLQAGWLAGYFDAKTEYTISYRGEPAIDVDDQIFVESPYVEDNIMRIEEETISTSTGMNFSCSLKGRRTSYREDDE